MTVDLKYRVYRVGDTAWIFCTEVRRFGGWLAEVWVTADGKLGAVLGDTEPYELPLGLGFAFWIAEANLRFGMEFT